MKRTLKDYLVLMFKGMAMGAADVVPGVSGGTIAFIVGFYDELINSIKSINGASLKLLFTGKIAAFWKAINANFLFSILLGIGISVFSLAKLITWLLLTHPILVWAFFFGLVLASTWFVSKDIKEWINIGFEEFLQDNDLNAFVKALEYAVRAKDSISGISKKTGISRSNLYAIFNGEQQPQLSTTLKIIKELGYTIQVA